ncbi:MAG: ATP-binding protein [Gracilimonas sp.]
MSRAKLISPIKNKTWTLAFLLTLVALSYGLFEIWVEHGDLSDAEQTQLANEAINKALSNYHVFESDFVYQSNQFTGFVKRQIENSAPTEDIITEAENDYDFWGASVFKESELWLWSKFGAQTFPGNDVYEDEIIHVDIERSNNVTFLSYYAPLKIEKGDSKIQFTVITRKKIQQENILPIGRNAELKPSTIFQSESDYPVHFSFFQQPPQNPQFSTILSTQSIDSAGVIYTLAEDYSIYKSAQQNQYFLYRAIFYAVLISLISLFLIFISRELSSWKSLLLKLFAITLAWLFFSNLDYGVGWIEIFYALGQQDFAAVKPLVEYSIHSIFILLIAIICFKPLLSAKLELLDRPKNILTPILLLFGILNALLLYFFFIETHNLFVQSSIPVLDLEVFPNWQTLIFYISSGVFAISSIILLILLGWFLLKLSVNPPLISVLLIISGYLIGIFLIFALSLYPEIALWLVFITSFLFTCILGFIILSHLNPDLFIYASRLRLLLLLSFLSVCITYVAVYKGYSERLTNQMESAAQLFLTEEATEAEQIARSLLTNLEQTVSILTKQDFIQRPAFVENYFTQQTQQIISEEWESFSISTQLVDNSGNIIAEYSSDLDSPAWTRAFNMLSLVIPFEEEQIRVANLRPIVRERPLNEANSNYSSFRRAWIPFFEDGDPEKRTGWILCSVYREKPQFEKPLRAVIASEGSSNWNASISITEYVDGRASRRNIVGIPLELPGYVRLPDGLMQQIQQDSTVFRTVRLANQHLRELFIANTDNQIIRAATNHPGLDNHLFSVLRFFFSVLIAGLFVLSSLSWKKDLNILGHNRRFRDRLIDRFILASLICLIALIGTTYYAIKNQNQKSVQDQLLNKLENLAEAITLQEAESPESSGIPLNELTSTLDADASLYRNNVVSLSTTSQIYSQHLLPRLLPWYVYESIYTRGNSQVTRKVTLGNQELLIGYQPWMNEEGNIAGIVAIPTFLDAPKFNEQLLSTTSYLLGFYVIIFGIFILGAALISTQLTAPLEALREGLKKISGGNLETTLPVKSKDEIGSLTNAYNVMVYRLKDLQEDLAQAEREAAWKEMAQQVAHEIKNPLTPMKLNLQHLQRQLNVSDKDFNKLKPQIEKITKNMIGQIESLSQIANDFSKFARPISQEFSPIELNELLVSIAELYNMEDKLTIKTNLYDKEIWVSGVKAELRRVIVNLVKNAYEAMPNGGEIVLSSDVNKIEELIFISVEDQGEGIPDESRDHIFVPNFSTKSSGTGLGLAITKKIVEEHEGTITFTSTRGKGSTFIIQLPSWDSE